MHCFFFFNRATFQIGNSGHFFRVCNFRRNRIRIFQIKFLFYFVLGRLLFFSTNYYVWRLFCRFLLHGSWELRIQVASEKFYFDPFLDILLHFRNSLDHMNMGVLVWNKSFFRESTFNHWGNSLCSESFSPEFYFEVETVIFALVFFLEPSFISNW